MIRLFVAGLSLIVASSSLAIAQSSRLPNIVYIMSDELAYYELGCTGNERLRTPNIDQFAAEGIRFTNALAGSPVCAPLRCNLMTGKHAGHASVRANDGGTPLRAGEATIASILKQRGYATGGFGKWGCGGRDSTGVPEKHGFDIFFGYYDQVHAHSFYPPYLLRNSDEVPLKGNIGGRTGETYSHYEIMDEAFEFIRANQERPFFCYLPITPPHGMYDIPESDPAWELYQDDPWMNDPQVSQEAKNYAAMVSMIDKNVGDVLALLRKLDLEKDTIVFFAGDNGGQDRFKTKEYPRGYFGPNVNPDTGVEFRGGKGNLYEGGLRIPSMVRWPGQITPGQVSDLVFYHPDILPTIAELTDSSAPEDIDGISILPTLLGDQTAGHEQAFHEFLYWEYGSQTAVRMQQWKAIQTKKSGDWQLYDLDADVSEANDVANENPDTLKQLKEFAVRSHTPVQAGTYSDPSKARHQRDRQAKWGTSRPRESVSKTNSIKNKNLIPPDEMTLHSFSSENIANDRKAIYAIDGKPKTVWHSQYSGKLAKPPHELVIDLGKQRTITGFRYLARQDSGWNGVFKKTEFYISDDPNQFGKPAVLASFSKSRTAQKADLSSPITGRYVRVRVLSEVSERPFASAAELASWPTSVEPRRD